VSAVLGLTWSYFTGTPLMRRLSALGLVCFVVGIASYSVVQPWTLGTGVRPEALWFQASLMALPWLGLILLLTATALMPAMVERMSLGRAVWVLPGGRLRLLASAVLPAVLLALFTATGATAAFIDYPIAVDLGRSFYRTLLMAFGDFGLIYTAIWLVGKTSGVWRLAGTVWVVISITIPLRYVGGVPPFSPLEGLGLASWLVFAVLLLGGGRIRHSLQRFRARLRALGRRALPAQPYSAGSEADLLLGTTRPWIVALGQLLPIGVMVWFVPVSGFWIVFIVTFSAISGAITSQAAARSRRLWLRYDWTREEIHRRVERLFWRYNAYSLGVLVLLYIGLGLYAGFRAPVLALSIALIVLGYVTCTYLGLMITRGLGWLETTLGILTMTVLTLGAFAIVRGNLALAIELEILLAGLAFAYRLTARSRWLGLDWMQCRFETAVRGAR
jgi:hypothetical protein